MSKLLSGKEYRGRVIDKQIDDYLDTCGAVCIEGPKWCGKTWTSAYHSESEFLVGDPAKNFQNRQFAMISPEEVLEGETPRLIDEWQEVPALWDAIRGVVDKRGKSGQFLITGSSTPKIKGVLHSGAGRIARLRMHTMSLYETGDSSGEISLSDICGKKFVNKLTGDVNLRKLATFAIRGGWPGNLSSKEQNIGILPLSYVDAILSDDIQRLSESQYDKHKLRLLLRSLARNESTTCSNLSLIKDIQENDNSSIDRDTVVRYLEAFDRLFLLDNQKPFSPNFRSSLRVKQGEKHHFCDPALACAILGITVDKLIGDLNTFGFIFEAMVEHDLKVYAQSFGGELYHYQDYLNNEIDAVIELQDGRWCAFEIKLGANRIDEGAKNLIHVNKVIEANGGKPADVLCVICGMSNAAYMREDEVYVIPFTALKN